MIGGRGVKPVERFDPSTESWVKLGRTPIELHHFQAASYQGKIYIAGAFTGGYPHEQPVANVLIFDPETDNWTEGPEIPMERRRGASAVVIIGNKLYLLGGIIDGHSHGTVSWVDMLDLESGQWSTLSDAPNARDHLTAVTDGQDIYLLGGRRSDYHEPDNFMAFFKTTQSKVDRYDISAGKWVSLGSKMPVPTAGGGAAYFNQMIYYTAGESGQKEGHDELQVFDIKTETWQITGTLEKGRHGTSLALLENRIYIAAGSGNQGGGPELGSIEVLVID